MVLSPKPGWNADGSIHWLPGRLLLDVTQIKGSRPAAQWLAAYLRSCPGILNVRANHLTGRVLIRFHPARVTLSALVAAARRYDLCGLGTGVLVPLGGRTARTVKALAGRAGLAAGRVSAKAVFWVRLVGRRALRWLGRSGFRAARAWAGGGRHVWCLVQGGHPVAIACREVAAAQLPVAWHALGPDRAVSDLGSSAAEGLSPKEALERRRRWGPNRLRSRPAPGGLFLLARQVIEPMHLILLGAALISFMLGQSRDAVVILGIIIVNSVLGMVQERKAGRTLESVGNLRPPMARVLRAGQSVTVTAEDLVPGDIVSLEAGDQVPADLRLISAVQMQTDEAALTGESAAVSKQPDGQLPVGLFLGDRRNMAYMGTFVRSGRGRGIVVATGTNTEMGRIAGLISALPVGPTPLQRKLGAINRALVLGAVAASAAMILVGVARGMAVGQLLVPAISTAVAAIPEGLPITVTVAMAVTVYRMGAQKAVVRKLPAVETLGATTVICTDKTGTLTQNLMTVKQVWAGGTTLYVEGEGYSPQGCYREARAGPAAARVTILPDGDVGVLLRMATLCTNAALTQTADGAWHPRGDPTEVAILVAAARAGLIHEEVRRRHRRLHETPFDPARRTMTVVCQDEQGKVYAQMKGAPDRILSGCTHWRRGGQERLLHPVDRERIEADAAAMASAAMRVLAVAYRPLPDQTWHAAAAAAGDWVFAGLLGMRDPVRPEVPWALKRCREAGVRVMMVTGDHPHTAAAIAGELGLAPPGSGVLTGAEIERMTDAQLSAALPGMAVCARVAPDQKLRVVNALQRQKFVVAMTGDGMNDAAAMHAADVGIAMGLGGTDTTRAAADIILMDDNFATIVAAVAEGRGAADNIRRTVRYTLATNAAEITLMLGAVLFGTPLPLLPVHLLWVNLVCDGVPALALAFDRPGPDCMKKSPQPAEDGLLSGAMWLRVAARGIGLGAGILGLFWGIFRVTASGALARSAAMATLVVGKLLYLFEVRRGDSGRPERRLEPNGVLSAAAASAAGLFLATLYVPFLQKVFGTAGLPGGIWPGVAAVALAAIWVEKLAVRLWECKPGRGPGIEAAAGY